MSSPEEILAQLDTTGAAFADKKPGAREQLIKLSHDLIASLELPSEAIQRVGWAETRSLPHRSIVELFETLKDHGAQGITAKELAAKLGAHGVLISRTMKNLDAMNVVGENGADTYVSTPLSDSLAQEKYCDGIIYKYVYHVAGPSFRGLPEYLKSIKYDSPTEFTNGPFQAAHKTQPPFFTWLDVNPPYLQIFNSYMEAYRAGKPSWVDPSFYTVSEQLAEKFDLASSEVALLKEKQPALAGKLVLQDRAEVIDTVTNDGDVFEATAHDFSTAQPVKGARAYYLHSVLHDWGDEDCIKIFEQLKPAMKPGYSTLLINEIIVPSQEPGVAHHVDGPVDVRPWCHAGADRVPWDGILRRAGVHIQKIYSYQMGSESLIKAVPT